MDHETALNLILANACQQEPTPEGYAVIYLGMHCKQAKVIAKHNGDLTYTIISVELEDD